MLSLIVKKNSMGLYEEKERVTPIFSDTLKFVA